MKHPVENPGKCGCRTALSTHQKSPQQKLRAQQTSALFSANKISTMAAAPPPAKLKAVLAQIKETFLSDKNNNDSIDVSLCYSGVVATELVQRGVLLPTQDDISWNEKLFDLVRSTAGRSLLNEATSIPKPLLAGTSAMSGMVAERCLAGMEKNPQVMNMEKTDGWKSALTRCREVTDDRLALLLQLPFLDENGVEIQNPMISEWKFRLSHVAEGLYLRAASFQPDPPQMWKRSFDVIGQRQSWNTSDKEQLSSYEATFPLENLIRIAESKGNAKRVSELSLKLAESWLGPEFVSNNASSSSIAILQNIRTAFVIVSSKDSKIGLDQRSRKSRQALEKSNLDHLLENTDTDAKLRYELISLQIELAQEDAEIEALANEKYTVAKNRSQGGLSLETCLKVARNEILVNSIVESQDHDDLIGNRAASLFETVRSSHLLFQENHSTFQEKVLQLIQLQIERLVARARAIGLAAQKKSKKKYTRQHISLAWSSVSDFLVPLFCCLQEMTENSSKENNVGDLNQIIQSLTEFPRKIIEIAATTTVSVAWMTAGKKCMDIMPLVCATLSRCLDAAATEKLEQEKVSSSVDVVKAEEKNSPLFKLEASHASAKCFVILAEMGTDSSTSVRQIQEMTEQAIRMNKKVDRYADFQGSLGVAFLQFLVCWSGLYRSAWPFCNVTQARLFVNRARHCIAQGNSSWGRWTLPLEDILLDLGHADSEGGMLIGGFIDQAKVLYQAIYDHKVDAITSDLEDAGGVVLKAHCSNGLARITLYGGASGPDIAEAHARNSLAELEQLQQKGNSSLPPLYLWIQTTSTEYSVAFHINMSRQLVADSLLRASRPDDARSFLEDAVRDAPAEYDAAFALGAFLMRLVCFQETEGRSGMPSALEEKQAQTQLLKSAKLGSSKADPFSLLGLWYERLGDLKRAIGCYSKALLLEPPHPVAGRGILRLRPFNEVKKMCDVASNTNSPLNGWAWRALGEYKAMSEGDDDLAILCYQKALRCRDFECPENEHLGVFYCIPSSTGKLKAPSYPSDLSDSWADLAGCYRRLGRYSAALRAFAAAHEAAGDNLPSPALCSWAQVELDLGLHEEAAEKFAIVLDRNDGIAQLQAAYGQGCALLALAQTDFQDGKGGIAFEHLSLAIDGLLESLVEKDDAGSATSFFVCALKLLGDLYCFGANLPPDVFLDENTRDDTEVGVRSQIAFIARGEEAYRAVESMQEKEQGDSDLNALWVAAVCDLGANILLQGQLLSSLNGEGSGVNNECSSHHIIRKVPEVNDKFANATKIFQRAVDINPLFAPAWCGLGCATTDPLLQQHAFCRALQLNKTAPEIWSNLGFLYARHDSLDASASMMDALTQVADTPLMWIGRALILERQVWASSIDEDADEKVNDESESALTNAADAYRAALQVMKEPNALLGLALNCRMTKAGIKSETGLYTKVANEITRKQSHGYLNEYFYTTGGVNKGATALKGVVTIEEGAERAGKPYGFGSEELMEEGSSIIGQEIKKIYTASPGAPAAFDASNFSAGLACSSIQRDLLEDLAGPGSSRTGELSTAKADASLPFKDELSQARQIVHDPDNGKLWLNLAKNLVGDLVSVSANGSPKRKIVRTTLESATLAADRSARFLTSQLSKAKQILPQQSVSATKPVTSDQEKPLARAQSSVPKIVHAEDVSEALSLSYWVAKVGSEMTEESEVPPERSFDLQRSLMMCPSNALGRQALAAVSKKELQIDANQ